MRYERKEMKRMEKLQKEVTSPIGRDRWRQQLRAETEGACGVMYGQGGGTRGRSQSGEPVRSKAVIGRMCR
jgi:hypothetical protein